MNATAYTVTLTGTNARGEKVFSVSDAEGNAMELILTAKAEVIDPSSRMPIGTNMDEDYVAIRKMMQADQGD